MNKEKGSLVVMPLGRTVSRLLSEFFPKVIDVDFTAKLEDGLDLIEEDAEELGGVLERVLRNPAGRAICRKKDDEEPEAGGEGNLHQMREVRQEHGAPLGKERGISRVQRQARLQ